MDFLYRNNEMVVEASTVFDGLPGTIEAFFYMPGETDIRPRKAHAAFLAHYALQAEEGPPLLLLDIRGGGDRPFSAPQGTYTGA